MRVRPLPLLALAAFVCAAPSTVRAQSVSVLGLESIDAPEADAARLTDALRQRLAGSAGFHMVPGKDYVEMKLVFGCIDESQAACMAQAGKSLGADKLVYGTLKGQGGKGKYVLSLRLLDVKGGTTEKYLPAEALTADDLSATKVNGVAARLLAQLMGLAAQGSLTITSEPPGAGVTIDGQQRGETPLTVTDLSVGSHTVVVSKSGYKARTETADFRSGEPTKLDLTLESGGGTIVTPPPATTTDEHPGRTLRIVGIAGLVAAAVLAAVALYTWRHYTDLENDAQQKLATVQGENPQYAMEQAAWFAKPNCTYPGSAPTSAGAQPYVDKCHEGETFAGATTGLWVGAGVLAVGGAVALTLGFRAKAAAEKPPQPQAGGLRLRAFGPSGGPTGGGFTATFEF
jgi:hypothetical protein